MQKQYLKQIKLTHKWLKTYQGNPGYSIDVLFSPLGVFLKHLCLYHLYLRNSENYVTPVKQLRYERVNNNTNN